MNVQFPQKWWSTLKCAVFSSSSAFLLLVNEGGGLVCESVDKADLLSNLFDNKLTHTVFIKSITARHGGWLKK